MTAVHTEGNAVPPLDENLAYALDRTAGVHAGIDLIRDGIRLIALDRLTPDETQTLIARLAGSSENDDVLTALAHLIARLSNADTNPSLRTLPLDQQKTAQHHGEQAQFHLTDEWLHQHASEASAAIDGI